MWHPVDPLLGFVLIASLAVACGLFIASNGLSAWDALFMGVSVVTSTGLSPIDYTTQPTGFQIVLFVAMICGGNILLSAAPAVVRFITLSEQRRHYESLKKQCNSNVASMIASTKHEATVALLAMLCCILGWVVEVASVTLLLWSKFPLRWATFLSISCVNNVGLSPSTSDFILYRNDMFIVGVFAAAMPLGNTLFPVVLRLSFKLAHYATSVASPGWHVLGRSMLEWHVACEDILQHPRAFLCHLFSSQDTIALVLLWCVITLIEFIMFIPEYHTSVFPTGFDLADQVMLAWFQTVSVRTSGFTVLDITTFRAGHLAMWMVAMYIAAYPLVLIGRARRMHQQDSLNTASNGGASIAGRDLAWLYLSVVVILFAQDRRLGTTQLDPSFFLRTCFEVCSAFGNVGLSLSRTSGIVSFSSELNWVSRTVVMILMVVGKMRCLPSEIVLRADKQGGTLLSSIEDDSCEEEEMSTVGA